MSDSPARMIKLGGSLLERAEWIDDFRRWLARQPAMPSVLIVGGGKLADAIRQWDRVHHLDASDAHWLAIGTMSLTAQLAWQLLPEAEWTDDWSRAAEFIADPAQSLLIFDPTRFLQSVESSAAGEPLPHGWEVTSDSIAARIAGLLNCRELVLLKSSLPAGDATTLERLAEVHYVDRRFPQFAAPLPLVRLVHLRDGEFAEMAIRHVAAD
jgi:5-(aminomethyl)-3-furanmethanol phosphate kinase